MVQQVLDTGEIESTSEARDIAQRFHKLYTGMVFEHRLHRFPLHCLENLEGSQSESSGSDQKRIIMNRKLETGDKGITFLLSYFVKSI